MDVYLGHTIMISSMNDLKNERKRISEFTGPVMPSQIPNITIDLPKLGKYLFLRGISFNDLTETEYQKFLLH